MTTKMLLAGDLGATNTRLAYYSTEKGLFQPVNETALENKDFKSFDDLLENFLNQHQVEFSGICLGIAGPVVNNTVNITNLGWDIDGEELKERYKLQGVWLLNDLKALSYAVLNLPDEECEVIRPGKRVENAPIAVIAPGTGLGEGFLIWDGEKYQAVSTEGGHTDFGPTNEMQENLVRYLHKKGIRVSYERVCSGIGIPNLYEFLRDEGYAEEPDWLRDEIAQAEDMPPVIFSAALDEKKDCKICRMTIDLFVEILGAEAGNLALKTLAQGGIFIGGGIPPRILSWFKEEKFLKSIDSKDPHMDLMSKIPVKVILNPIANLIGAASYGIQELK
jgi:glucokinase